MNPDIESSVDRLTDRARHQYQRVIGGARSQTVEAANRVQDGKKPVRKLSRLGVDLTSISHRATADVLKSQAKMVENQIDALAGRLHAAARAPSLKELIRGQIQLVPANAARFVEDTRATLSVVKSAGGDVKEVLTEAARDLRGKTAKPAAKTAKTSAKPAKKRQTRKKAAKKTARKTASKASASKKKAKPAKKSKAKAAKKTAS